MIVATKSSADVRSVERALTGRGLWTERFEAEGRTYFYVAPHSRQVDEDDVLAIPGVESVGVRREISPRVMAQPKVFSIGGTRVGAECAPVVIAGPCSVESELQIFSIAERLSASGVELLRGGAFKPRSSPYAFQGHGEDALRWMRRAASAHRMKMVTEVMGLDECAIVCELADLVQIGSRNMHNYALLKGASAFGRPILLKRGMAATIDEWLQAGEYCLLHGAPFVIFCERGIRSFDPSTRNLLDLGAVALLSGVHGLPVIVDPSHAVGRRDLIPRLSKAALAAGACGLMIETHEDPSAALSDGPQALTIEELCAVLEPVQSASLAPAEKEHAHA
jgi:3-deoxy-7-phosphoheptulonate synthase